MNGTDLLRAMSHVDEGYVQAAEEERKKKPGAAPLRWGALAACAAVAVAAVFFLRQPGPVAEQPPEPIPDPVPGVTEPIPDIPDRLPPDVVPESPAPDLTIDLSQIAVNELPDGLPSGALRYDFYLTHDELEWDETDIIGWFGKADFTPAFLPDGLTPAQGNNSATVWTDRDGVVVIDLLRFSARDEDDERIFPRSFNLSVSRNDPRPFRDWLHWGETVEVTPIAGVDVIFTHASYSHGPYDPETHTPTGYYDWYDVDFELDGLKYALTAQRLTLQEVAAVTASIITGDTNFTVTGGEQPQPDPPDPPEAVPTPGP